MGPNQVEGPMCARVNVDLCRASSAVGYFPNVVRLYLQRTWVLQYKPASV